MPRLHKLRRRQKFQYNVNRKQLKKKLDKLPAIKSQTIKNAWDSKRSLNENLRAMGLVADANADGILKIPSGKLRTAAYLSLVRTKQMTPGDNPVANISKTKPLVVDALEQESKDAYKAKKNVSHTLPKEMVKKLTKLLDKYGEDYEAMSRDYANYDQETPAQLRTQISKLKKIPQQWIPYVKSRGLLYDPLQDSDSLEIGRRET